MGSGSVWSMESSSAGGPFSRLTALTSPMIREWPIWATGCGDVTGARGLASEGAWELVRYGFEDLGLDRIIAQTIAANSRSRGVMERIGFSYVRLFPSSMKAFVEGVEEGEVEYEMTREQWELTRA